MAILAILALVSMLAVYISIHVICRALNNYHAHKFFRINSPKLPVVPNPNILFGNLFQTVWLMKNSEQIDRWHNKLGKTFGFYIGHLPFVTTKDLDLIKKIEIDDANKHLDKQVLDYPHHEYSNSILQINGDKWRTVRRATASAFTNVKVRSNEVSADIERVMLQFIGAVDRKIQQEERTTNERSIILNVHDYAQRITLAIIFLLLCRRENVIDFDAAEDSLVGLIERAGPDFLNPMVPFSVGLPVLRPFITWLSRFRPVGRMDRCINDYINSAVDPHQATERTYGKVLGANQVLASESKSKHGSERRLTEGLINALSDGKITEEEYKSNAYILVMAGSETTATTIAWILWQLAQNPTIQTKLREVISNEGMDADYVVWCIMEGIRYHPPAPLFADRVITEDITTNDGLLIPKGTSFMPSIYSIHHDESIWPEHDKFIPERWQNQSESHPAAFVGFGLGARNCPGGRMAIHEIKLVLKNILTRYRVDKCEGTPDKYRFVSPGLLFTIPEVPVKLRFTPLPEVTQ